MLDNQHIKPSDTIEYITKDKLTPHPKNPRLHPHEQLELLSNSIAKFNFTNPILIDENNVILAGHGRVECIDDDDFQVPCRRIIGMSEEEKLAYVVIDNRSYDLGEYDKELLNELEQECSMLADMIDTDIENEVDSVSNTSKELDINDYSEFENTCPRCGFGFNND